jgi:hypothetical protein
MDIEEQVCFLQAGRFINDISILNKLIYISTKSERDDIELKAHNTQSFSLLLLFAGVLNECMHFLNTTYSNNPKKTTYDNLLNNKSVEIYNNLLNYTNNKNYIKIIRKKIAFHRDGEIYRDQLAKLKDDDKFEIYFHDITGNCLYHISSIIILKYLLDMIDSSNHENALKILIGEILDISNMILEFLNDFIGVITKIHGANFEPLEEIEMKEPPSIDSLSLPYFIK